MTKPVKPSKAQQIATLERKLMESQAQAANIYHFAKSRLLSANRDKIMGSGVIVRLSYLGGKDVCDPFMIKDGFSDETIKALIADMVYSYERAIEFKP